MEVKEAIEFIEDSYTYLYVDLHGNKEEVKKFGEIVDLLKSMEAENKALKKFKDMWEWIQGVEMWNKEYEKIVKEVVQDIEVGYESGKVIEKIGYEKVEDKGLDDGIFNKQNQRYIKKINTFKKLKQENEAYKEMWEILKADMKLQYCITPQEIYMHKKSIDKQMINLEKKYLGGGE